jgi:hypothetical protein
VCGQVKQLAGIEIDTSSLQYYHLLWLNPKGKKGFNLDDAEGK